MEHLENIKELLKHNNVFLTGAGGTGKSYTTKNIIHYYERNDKNVVILGSTGLAAANIGGQTIHSFFKIGFSKNIDEYEKYLATTKPEIAKRIQEKLDEIIPCIDLLIIDEISMVSKDLLDLINYLLQSHMFNGKLLFVGDFFQLPPVTKSNEQKGYAFQSNTWIDNLKLKTYLLTDIYRTKDDKFIDVLNSIRIGNINDETIAYLNKLRENKHSVKSNLPTILCSTNKVSTYYNKKKLDELPFPEHNYKWKLFYNNEGKSEQQKQWWFDKYKKRIFDFGNSLLAEKELKIKVGCSIIFIANGDRFYNGEKGRVIEIKETLNRVDEYDEKYDPNGDNESVQESLIIEKQNGEIVELFKYKWELIEYNGHPPKIDKNIIATIHQYPIKLAYSSTIHKAQGMSIDNLICDINNIFEEHQFYVCISRAINPSNLYIHYKGPNFNNYIKKICKVNSDVKEFYNKLYK